MELVIDANILFSALIKKGKTVELLFDDRLTLYTTDFIITEFFKYKEIILKKTHRTEGEFIQTMHMMQDVITVFPQEEYTMCMQEAEEISPDPKDIMYFALALKLRCGIWTNDKKLKKQNRMSIYSTEQIQEIIK